MSRRLFFPQILRCFRSAVENLTAKRGEWTAAADLAPVPASPGANRGFDQRNLERVVPDTFPTRSQLCESGPLAAWSVDADGASQNSSSTQEFQQILGEATVVRRRGTSLPADCFARSGRLRPPRAVRRPIFVKLYRLNRLCGLQLAKCSRALRSCAKLCIEGHSKSLRSILFSSSADRVASDFNDDCPCLTRPIGLSPERRARIYRCRSFWLSTLRSGLSATFAHGAQM